MNNEVRLLTAYVKVDFFSGLSIYRVRCRYDTIPNEVVTTTVTGPLYDLAYSLLYL